MKISILLTVFNCENTINQTLVSLLNQSFSNFKLYIVNNMSTDSTVDIIRKIDDNRIQILHNNERQSCSSSLNFGLKHIKEDVVVRADGDNIYNKDYIESLLCSLNENKIVYAPYKEVEADGASYVATGFKDLEPFLWTMLFCNTVDHNVAYYKKFILNSGGYKELDSSEDYQLWTECLLNDNNCITCVPGDEAKVTTYKTNNSITKKLKEINDTNINISKNFINKLLNVNCSHSLIRRLKEAKIYKKTNLSKADLLHANRLLLLFIEKFNINSSIISKYRNTFYFYV